MDKTILIALTEKLIQDSHVQEEALVNQRLEVLDGRVLLHRLLAGLKEDI